MTDNAQSNRSAVSKALSRRLGFSLVELLVVVGVILLLIGILMPSVNRAQISMMKNMSRMNINMIEQGCRQYYNDFKQVFPPSTGMGSLDGKNMIVVYLTGYADDTNGDSTPGSSLSTDDGKGGWGWRTEKRGRVYGPYNGAERIPISSSKEFLDAFEQPIYYYRHDSGYHAGHNSDGPGYLGDLSNPSYKYRRDFVLMSSGPDGEWGEFDSGEPESGFDDANNFLGQ